MRTARNALEGIFSGRTATFYRLDPTGRVPLARIGELLTPGDPNRVSFDMVESEAGETSAEVSRHAVEQSAQVTPGFVTMPETRTITGLMSSSIPIPLIGGVGGGAILSALQAIYGVGTRPDLVSLANLRALQRAGEPVAVLTPRWSHLRMLIRSVGDSWAPGQGELVRATVTLEESRIVSPLVADGEIADAFALTGGPVATSAAGSQPGTPSASAVTGGGPLASPTVGGAP